MNHTNPRIKIKPATMNITDNARDFVDKLDALILLRSHPLAQSEEGAELIKRDLTDFLLLADKRAGVFVKGDNQ